MTPLRAAPPSSNLGLYVTDGGEEVAFLFWAIVFLLVAILAGVLGFAVIAGVAAFIARVLFFIFLVVAIVWLVGMAFNAVRRIL